MTDLVPTGLTYVDHTPSQGSYNRGTGDWNIGALAVDASATLVSRCRVNLGVAATTPSIVNSATVDDTNASVGDPDLRNNAADAEIFLQFADLEVDQGRVDPAGARGPRGRHRSRSR